MLFPEDGEVLKVEGEQAMWEEESGNQCGRRPGALIRSSTDVLAASPSPYEARLLRPSPIARVPEDIIVPRPPSQVLEAPKALWGTRDSGIESQAGEQTGGAGSTGSGITMMADS